MLDTEVQVDVKTQVGGEGLRPQVRAPREGTRLEAGGCQK